MNINKIKYVSPTWTILLKLCLFASDTALNSTAMLTASLTADRKADVISAWRGFPNIKWFMLLSNDIGCYLRCSAVKWRLQDPQGSVGLCSEAPRPLVPLEGSRQAGE